MQLMITKPALDWYKREMDISDGDYVRFYARYGGSSPIQKGFSLGMSMEQPKEPQVQVTDEGITFYIEREDLWYFDDHNLTIAYDEKSDEIEFQYN